MNTNAYEEVKDFLMAKPHTWLITGVAGFIGSNLLEILLSLNQRVIGLDNFSTGNKKNLEQVRTLVPNSWRLFTLIEGDIRSLQDCLQATAGVDFVLHQAALGSVPRSLEDPIMTNQVNIDGFLNMLVAARDLNVKRFIYAASSSTYGDHPSLPKVENHIGKPLSPYAVTKYVNELYADIFSHAYELETIGLRYFNVFGARQSPNGPYAAVVPKWISSMMMGEQIWINGDGRTSRDFCYIANVVQANLLAATCAKKNAIGEVFNIAIGEQTTLVELFEILRSYMSEEFPHLSSISPSYRDFRPGDIRHSLASIEKAKNLLGYKPTHCVKEGIAEALGWYIKNTNI